MTIGEKSQKIQGKKIMDKRTFTIKVSMESRWVPHFLGMLKYMEYLGNVGASRLVSIYSDGDGDFHPKFIWDQTLPEPAKHEREGDSEGDRIWDAG
jgi:hypothetical protein